MKISNIYYLLFYKFDIIFKRAALFLLIFIFSFIGLENSLYFILYREVKGYRLHLRVFRCFSCRLGLLRYFFLKVGWSVKQNRENRQKSPLTHGYLLPFFNSTNFLINFCSLYELVIFAKFVSESMQNHPSSDLNHPVSKRLIIHDQNSIFYEMSFLRLA